MVKTRKRTGRQSSEAVEKSGLLRFIDRVTSLWKVYLIIFAVILVIGCIVVIWYYIDQNNQNNAAKALAIAQKEMQEKADKALDDDPENVDEEGLIADAVERYGEVMDKYPRSSSGKLARFRVASGQFQLGDYDESIDNYDKLSSEKSVIGVLSELGLGDCYLAKDEYETAGKHYEKARDRCKEKEFPYIPATIALADLYLEQGELDKAEELYREVINYHLYSPFAETAIEGLTEIEVKRELAGEPE
ncbi:MAG: tetratricopeptide repeat protein [bacterium]|nr:tetratricopeptide repeat protein [bacterium]